MKTCGTCGLSITKTQNAVIVGRGSNAPSYFHAEYQDCQKALQNYDLDKIKILVEGY
jgi:hypothetical protein